MLLTTTSGGVAVHQLLALRDSLRQALLDPDGMSRRVTATFAPIARRLGLDADAIGAWASGHASECVAGAGQYTMSAAAGIGGALLSFAFTALVDERRRKNSEPKSAAGLRDRVRRAIFAV